MTRQFAPPNAQNGLHLWLCGAPRLYLAEEDISFQVRYRKAWALLAFLAFETTVWQSRSVLARLLWPDLSDSAALTNLRQVLNNLAQVFNKLDQSPWLEIDRLRIRLCIPLGSWLDVATFLHLGEGEIHDTDPAWSELNQVLPLCLGEMLEGHRITEGSSFDEWLQNARQRLHRAKVATLTRMIAQHSRNDQEATALLLARWRWQIDPLGEESAAGLIRQLLKLDDRRGAEQVAAELDRNLRSELGIRPSSHLLNLLQISTPYSIQGTTTEIIEQRTLFLLFVALAPMLPSDGVDAGLTTLLAARTLLNDLRTEPLRLRGRGFWVTFGSAYCAEEGLTRALQVIAQLLQAFPERLCLGLASGPVICHTHPDGIDLFGLAPEHAWHLAHKAKAGEALASASLVAGLPGWLQAEQDTYRWQPTRTEFMTGAKKLTPMVSRKQHFRQLRTAWEKAKNGIPAWLAVVGDGGIGKTRLVQELIETLDTKDTLLLHLQCTPNQQRQPLAPLRQALLNKLLTPTSNATDLQTQLLTRWPALGTNETFIPAWPILLNFLQAEGDQQALINGRNDLFWAIYMLIDAISSHQPILLWMDDLHWADLATHEWWSHYAGLLENQSVLLLSTSRTDVPLTQLSTPAKLIKLQPLDEVDTSALVRLQAASVELDSTIVAHIAKDSGGIPLFVEFLTKHYLDGSTSSNHPMHGLLAQEIDRLGAFKGILQTAAVLGQRFYGVELARLVPEEPTPVLELACHYRLLEVIAEDCYEFRHALIRDAAYQGLPPAMAQRMHGLHADWLAVQQNEPAAHIAEHFEQARRWSEAIHWWQRAGELALTREFAADALACYLRAQELLPCHPSLTATQKRQLGFSIAKAALLSEGYGSERGHLQYQALVEELANDLNERENLFRALSGLYMGGSSFRQTDGLIIAEKMRPLSDTAAKQLMLCFAMGNSLFWRGCFDQARDWQEKGIALSESLSAEERSRYWGEDLGILLRAFLCWNAWFVGDEQLAANTAADGIALARSGGKPHALCFMLAFASAERWCADDASGCAQHANEGLILARHHGFPLWQGIHGLFSLWSQARKGLLNDLSPVLQAAEQFSQAYRAGSTTACWVMASILYQLNRQHELSHLLAQMRFGIAKYGDEYCLSEVLMYEAHLTDDRLAITQLHNDALNLARLQGAFGLLKRLQQFKEQTVIVQSTDTQPHLH
ncbi:AAA family ATPase [Chitinibacter fontanus]|uniref:AAA family ATPase n=1 Tax=Chitinibacter fontanus TaxID=1737446 RepID=A0A7D5V9K4_9NEIS|nr:AAA family ATPase [Chitinibacter fontanus]QLI81192.1 AAA family ATPase [Chitinibacter fontanus]